MSMDDDAVAAAPAARFGPGAAGALLWWTVAIYALYALYMLYATLDFLELLDRNGPAGRPTYELIVPVYMMVDLVICACFGFVVVALRLAGRRGWLAIAVMVLLTLLRAGLIFYLYYYDGPDGTDVPFIYKTGDDYTEVVRGLFLPAQVLLGLAAAFACRPRRSGAAVVGTDGVSAD